jgi:hypothetical protein
MPVPEEMRRIEEQIDQSIAKLPIWNYSRSVLLHHILQYYRDAIEILFAMIAPGALEDRNEEIYFARMREQRLRFGVFQTLKWVMEFSSDRKKRKAPTPKAIHRVIEMASNYQVVVDYLKSAKHDLVTIAIDQKERTVTIYEGGDLTGSDSQLVFWQHERLTNYTHVDLTHDDDQLTNRWNAGQFRSVVKHMRDIAEGRSDTVCFSPKGEMLPLFLRPRIVQIADLPDPALNAALEDLTLASEKVQGNGKWRLVSFIETPLVLIGKRRFGVSDILIALDEVGPYDYMLRVASRVDPAQYTKVSGLRERRMMDMCSEHLAAKGWGVETGVKISEPLPRELDVMAQRDGVSMLLQLKSTLRPEAPWEVFKRNQDILEGIQHTSEVASMLPQRPVAFVITDGYRGDYITWASALQERIPIGTLRDLEDLAADPFAAIDLLKERVGFDLSRPPEPIPDRSFEIMGWTMRVVDATAPVSDPSGCDD